MPSHFGDQIAARREKLSLTQSDLAALAGVNRKTVGSIESSPRFPAARSRSVRSVVSALWPDAYPVPPEVSQDFSEFAHALYGVVPGSRGRACAVPPDRVAADHLATFIGSVFGVGDTDAIDLPTALRTLADRIEQQQEGGR